ncbi:MAG: electron transport complex subunit RsxC [Bacteroidetes bacterium HGW-Bacteroidetes-4]|jgi:electron transport complex protein RnfC|nr:MAG: electron transport complex subunit RsxC [Bacteroidetes bacterium HGW-Bacteroidetes-4]
MLKTFKKGGVHPAENKLSAHAPIVTAELPKVAIIPMGQHIGAPASPLVQKGDEVKVGQLIAQSSGFVSANIHASVSGKVLKIDNAMDASGFSRQAVHITVDGDEWIDIIDRSPEIVKEIKATPEEIIKKVQEAGIVGLGGATFPSHIKLSVPPGKKAEVLLINGVECEPYLTADHRLMLEKGEEVLIGTKLLMMALGVTKAYVGIENNKPDAIGHLRDIAAAYDGIDIVPLKVKYPQGGEKQLIKAVINREVPSGALPIDVGAVVHNVGTAFAVYEAVQKNKPLFERVVTVTGKSVKNPSNFLVRIGTPTSQLIEAAGGVPEDTGKIVSGGPMMGKALKSLDVPIAKGSSGVLLFQDAEAGRRPVEPCIRCGKCVSVCPMGLEPYLLMTYSDKKMWEEAEHERTMDCIECGSCMYTCPADRPLLDYIRLGKSTVGNIIRTRKQ